MPNYDASSGAGTLRLEVNIGTANIPGNYTPISWNLFLICGNGLSNNSNPTGWEVIIHGIRWAGTYTFDFRGTTVKHIASGSENIAHNADGTQAIGGYGYTAHTGTSGIGGPIQAIINPTITLPRIPRGPRVEISPGVWQRTLSRVETSPGVWQTAITRVETSPGVWQITS